MICFQNRELPSDLEASREETNRAAGRKKDSPRSHFFIADERRQYLSALKNFYKTLLFR
jgi:hypothetical protein